MMRRSSTLSIPLLLALGCGPGERNYYEQGDRGVKDLDQGPTPLIFVDPDRIDFGTVGLDDDGQHASLVTVYNLGEADLHIQNLEIEDADLPFVVTHIRSVLVFPEESTSFEVIFEPEQVGAWQGLLWLESDDPALPVVEIELLGEAE